MAATNAAAGSTPSPEAARWMHGPVSDLLVGCCLWYVLALFAFSFAGEAIRSAGAMTVLPFIVLIFSTPHYGATLLRVYERPADRRAYTLFTVHTTIVLFLVFAAGVHYVWIGSWIVTIYITWSPWHYSGQNYGLAVMFLRRRGVALDSGTKRFLHSSFVLSYALAFLALHGSADANHFVPVAVDPVNYRFLRLGLPPIWSNAALAICTVAYLIALGGAAVGLLRRGSPRDLAPAAALVLVQALWFSVPLLLRNVGAQSIEPWTSTYGSYYFLWVAIGHSSQYLWVTSYYARGQSNWSGPLRYFGKTMLAGAAVWTLPTLIFAPGALGRLPYDGGFALLAASLVNLHHFVLDGAIWKLRDGRVARMLLRDRDGSVDAAATPGGRGRWVAGGIWAIGAACVAIMFFAKWESDIAIPAAAAEGDVPTVRAAANRMAWIGRDSAKLRRTLGDTLLKERNVEGAIREYERANEIRPTVDTYFDIARLHARNGRWPEAIESYQAGLRINPDEESLLYYSGLAHLEVDDLAAAEQAFERAARVNPDRTINRTLLERTRKARRAQDEP